METGFKKTVLKNGLRIVTESVKDRASVHLGLHLLWGSRNEPAHMAGAAHLIEHMVFKGTAKRTAYEIARDIESVGGEIGASTGKEMTSYTVQCLAKDLRLGVDILADLTLNAEFTEEEFEKEKDVVLSEIDMTAENFEESVFDLAFEEIFKNNPLARPILGTEKSVKKIDCWALFDLYRRTYVPSKMVLSVSGDIDHEQVVKFAEGYFGNNDNTLGEDYQESLEGKFNPGIKSVTRNSEQAHVLINFPAPAYPDQNRYVAYIANLALGGGMTSVLYQKIREDLGLAYTVYSFLQCFLHEGVISIYVGTKPDKALDVVGVVVDEINKFIENGWTDEQLDLYREQLLGEILMGQDDLDSRMNSIGLNELVFEDYRSPEQVVSEIKAIDTKAMNEYFSKYFTKEPNIFVLAPK